MLGNTMRSLHINLTKKRFDRIESGRQTKAYREIKKYWAKRLIEFDKDIDDQVLDEFLTALKHPFNRHNGPESCMDFFGTRLRKIDTATFKNGCVRESQPVQRFTRAIKSISVDQRTPGSGPRPGEYCFVIEIQS